MTSTFEKRDESTGDQSTERNDYLLNPVLCAEGFRFDSTPRDGISWNFSVVVSVIESDAMRVPENRS
jgi:hypothetical protein